jgi:hypothetical protein
MEDTGEKIRRNLVVFSALILLAAWMRVPLAAVADKALIGLHADNNRAWIAVVVVHIYLMWRYRFAHETVEATKALAREHWVQQRRYVDRILKHEAELFVRTGAPSAVLGDALITFVASHFFPRQSGERVDLTYLSVRVQVRDDAVPGYSGSGMARVVASSNNWKDREVGEVLYSISSPSWFEAFVLGGLRALFYSHSSAELLFPVTLGIVALGVAVAKAFGF